MTLQVDSREKPRATKKIFEQFQAAGADFFISKLYVGDYMSYDNPRLVVDRKQGLTELCVNVTGDHARFRAELIRAQEHGIQVVILCEHGEGIRTLEDVKGWENPRGTRRQYVGGQWVTVETKATKGTVLYKILQTMIRKYGIRVEFCDKSETGNRILQILSESTGEG